MALLKYCRTIPELFIFLWKEYGKDIERPLMMKKVGDEYKGISYKEFGEQTENFAAGLASLGVKKGDKIAIISENRPEWVYSDMAILSLGAIDVPLYPSLTSDSIEFILNNSESIGVIVSNKFQLNKIQKILDNCRNVEFVIVMDDADAAVENNKVYSFSQVQNAGMEFGKENPSYVMNQILNVEENDLCTIIYTSGTTGEPKGVMLTHKNILSNVTAALEVFPINKDDIFLSFLPLCHIFERMGGYYTGFSSGGMICFAESIEAVAQNMTEVKPTIMTAVPRLFERIYSKVIKNIESQPASKQKIFFWAVNTGMEYSKAKKSGRMPLVLSFRYKLANKLVYKKLHEKMGGSMRFFISGGAALPREIGEFFEAVGILILEGYGLTESSPVISVNRIDDYKFGTVGKTFPNVQVKIASDGEILAKGPNIMQGYYKNKKESEATVKDGWLYTGDIGMFDADGFLVITDRKKHLFKTSAGKYIAPTAIESLFLTIKYIDQFVVIGDKRMFLSALIVPDFEALKEYADSNKIQYSDEADLVKKPEIYELVEKEMGRMQKKLANYERVRKFILLDKPFTIDSGEITPSMKIKRDFVEERYAHLIEEMYS